MNADYVATGHYARIDRSGTETKLLRGTDTHKDQSYVLFGTQRKVLDRMLLPIGELEKKQTRQIAEDKGLPVHAKPDSYEICFVFDLIRFLFVLYDLLDFSECYVILLEFTLFLCCFILCYLILY